MEYETFKVQEKGRAPLLEFILSALREAGCIILKEPPATEAPFRVTFATPTGERMGIIAYAFLATITPTKNRPSDEHRFQIKYGSKDGADHHLWQDPFSLYTTLFLGINPNQGFFVGADPVLHSPTKFFISLEFKQHHVEEIKKNGWHVWERESRKGDDPVEVLVGGTRSSFLQYVMFERQAVREDQGHRQLLAQKVGRQSPPLLLQGTAGVEMPLSALPRSVEAHLLAQEFQMSEHEVLDLIGTARRLKMAVRGWVAQKHLERTLCQVPGVTECKPIEEEGGADVSLRFEGSRPIIVECKNVLRERDKNQFARVDFQRTRVSKNDPCSRYYGPGDFDVLAACLHAVTERWEFQYVRPLNLNGHKNCPGKLASNVLVDGRWATDVRDVFRSVVAG